MWSLLLYIISSLLCVTIAQNIPVVTSVTDIIHMHFPPLPGKYISDFLVLGQIFLAIATVTSDIISPLFLVLFLTQMARAACAISTVLPPLQSYSSKLRLGGINGSGTEYIFSGHASYSALAYLILLHAGWNLPGLILYNFFSQTMIVITRQHYTVDVVLAWIIVPLIYNYIFSCLKYSSCFWASLL
jgi:hypothetical protein